jgi:hypothetical protein
MIIGCRKVEPRISGERDAWGAGARHAGHEVLVEPSAESAAAIPTSSIDRPVPRSPFKEALFKDAALIVR